MCEDAILISYHYDNNITNVHTQCHVWYITITLSVTTETQITWSDMDMNTGWRDLSETLQWLLQYKSDTAIKCRHVSRSHSNLMDSVAWQK